MPDSDFIEPVERYVEALIRDGWKRSTAKKETEDEITTRVRKSLGIACQVFVNEAGRPSMLSLAEILDRWNDLVNDPALHGKFDNHFEAAIDLELSERRLRKSIKDTAA